MECSWGSETGQAVRLLFNWLGGFFFSVYSKHHSFNSAVLFHKFVVDEKSARDKSVRRWCRSAGWVKHIHDCIDKDISDAGGRRRPVLFHLRVLKNVF